MSVPTFILQYGDGKSRKIHYEFVASYCIIVISFISGV